MLFGLPVVAYETGAVRETLHGGGLLVQDKRPEVVAELLDRLTHGSPLRRAVLASQSRAIAEIRATDFGALLRERLRPVLEGAARSAGPASAAPGLATV
jgi:glycosyltransferase involved in cell wall biosynthesis